MNEFLGIVVVLLGLAGAFGLLALADAIINGLLWLVRRPERCPFCGSRRTELRVITECFLHGGIKYEVPGYHVLGCRRCPEEWVGPDQERVNWPRMRAALLRAEGR